MTSRLGIKREGVLLFQTRSQKSGRRPPIPDTISEGVGKGQEKGDYLFLSISEGTQKHRERTVTRDLKNIG